MTDRIAKADCAQKALAIWGGLDSNSKFGVRFGLFPHQVIKAAEADGFDGHEICLALMACATKDGGMRA